MSLCPIFFRSSSHFIMTDDAVPMAAEAVAETEREGLLRLSAKLIDHRGGPLDVSVASYNHLIETELPRMINEMRPDRVEALCTRKHPLVWTPDTPPSSVSFKICVCVYFSFGCFLTLKVAPMLQPYIRPERVRCTRTRPASFPSNGKNADQAGRSLSP